MKNKTVANNVKIMPLKYNYYIVVSHSQSNYTKF
jgi:hypothetical protein